MPRGRGSLINIGVRWEKDPSGSGLIRLDWGCLLAPGRVGGLVGWRNGFAAGRRYVRAELWMTFRPPSKLESQEGTLPPIGTLHSWWAFTSSGALSGCAFRPPSRLSGWPLWPVLLWASRPSYRASSSGTRQDPLTSRLWRPLVKGRSRDPQSHPPPGLDMCQV